MLPHIFLLALISFDIATSIYHNKRIMFKTALLGVSIILGFIIPQAHILQPLIKYLLMLLLFFAFLDVHIDKTVFNKSIVKVFSFNMFLSFVLYFIVRSINNDMALLLFAAAVGPAATASPAIGFFMGKDVSYLTTAVLFSNIATALLLPNLYTGLIDPYSTISTGQIFMNTLMVIGVPLLAAYICKYVLKGVHHFLEDHKEYSIYILALNVFIAVAYATNYIRTQEGISIFFVIPAAILVGALCIGLFRLGRVFGGKEHAFEAGQSMGNKNTMLMLWFASTYVSPVAALGPILYLIADTTYNAVQMGGGKPAGKSSIARPSYGGGNRPSGKSTPSPVRVKKRVVRRR